MSMKRTSSWLLGGLFALFLLALVAGVSFWIRPVEVFRAVTGAQMYFRGADSRWAAIEGYRIHYYVAGPVDGPAVVLVHGLGGRSEDWVNLMPYLRRAGYRVYLPDLPGFGQSEQPANFSYSVRDQAAIVVAFLVAMNLKQVDLGGWSMGGWIVQRVASEHPGRVKNLMLFDSAGLYVRPEWDTSLFTPSSADQVEKLDALLMPHPPWVPGFVERDIVRESQRNAWVMRRALASMLTGRDTTDDLLSELKMPVLLVWGAEDHITPPSLGKTMRAVIPRAQLEVIPDCGHLAPNQCAAEIGPKVVGFLQQ